jgi:hypothetical protein
MRLVSLLVLNKDVEIDASTVVDKEVSLSVNIEDDTPVLDLVEDWIVKIVELSEATVVDT